MTCWYDKHETWENTPDKVRKLIHRDTSVADIKSEMELLKK